jgi:hypothetical protein
VTLAQISRTQHRSEPAGPPVDVTPLRVFPHRRSINGGDFDLTGARASPTDFATLKISGLPDGDATPSAGGTHRRTKMEEHPDDSDAF